MFSKDLESTFEHVTKTPLVLALTLAAAGCTAGGSPAYPHAASDAPNPFIEVAPAGAAARAWGSPVPAHLVFKPRGVTAVASAVDARVVAVDSRLGATVKAGEALLTLRSGEAAKTRAEFTAAEAKAATADDVLRRQNELVARGVGLEVERFAAETEARAARAELDRARAATALLGPGEGDRFVLRAPAPGVVLSLRATVGAVVTPGDEPLAEIGDPGSVWVQADVPEGDLAGVRVGGPARVRVGAADVAFDAVVDGVGGRIDGEQRRAAVYLRPVIGATRLVPGMLAEVRFAATDDLGVSVPVEAVLIKNGTDRIVYIQDGNGHYAPRAVRTGVSRDGRVTILDGVTPGENVVVRGALLLDGESEQLL
ncbi:MAG TPA: efflux RND transporter periplasmic adaptor subunit [Gammaproteobacteria bacterium]|nr:efflux RND transporter periplasmic adaptor subunit [Gammaproteobacteria bacterium]